MYYPEIEEIGGSDVDKDELSDLVATLPEKEKRKLCAMSQALTDKRRTARMLLNLYDDMDCYDFMFDIRTEYAVGYYGIYNNEFDDIPEELCPYFNFENYGHDLLETGFGYLTDYGFLIENANYFYKYGSFN